MVLSSPNSFTPGARIDQVGAIGQRHSSPIDGFVAEPSGVKLMRIEIDDRLSDRLIEDFEIDL